MAFAGVRADIAVTIVVALAELEDRSKTCRETLRYSDHKHYHGLMPLSRRSAAHRLCAQLPENPTE
jgi:hypothetical protein